MRDILRQSNLDLLREIERLREILQGVTGSIPEELNIYYSWAVTTCNDFRLQVMRNLYDLDLQQDAILPDLLSTTQQIVQTFHLFNQRLVSPILRVRPSDRLCLKLLRWMHSVHPQTQHIPAALSDGEFASWPAPPLPTIYYMPSSAQHGLLYLPLFFHEFGHLLYACYKPEMDDLVRDLQGTITELLEPDMRRDDLHAQVEAEKWTIIVETWYEWTQELFCDAVGLVIGGPAFVYAFSMYFSMLGRDEYHIPSEHLADQTHPVTWLRVRLLADRARQIGYNTDAGELENIWSMIAAAMEVIEDYYGFYAPEFLPAIQQIIDNMLTEVAPYRFNEQETSGSESLASSPVQLLNQAWREFLKDAEGYLSWERSMITAFLP